MYFGNIVKRLSHNFFFFLPEKLTAWEERKTPKMLAINASRKLRSKFNETLRGE